MFRVLLSLSFVCMMPRVFAAEAQPVRLRNFVDEAASTQNIRRLMTDMEKKPGFMTVIGDALFGQDYGLAEKLKLVALLGAVHENAENIKGKITDRTLITGPALKEFGELTTRVATERWLIVVATNPQNAPELKFAASEQLRGFPDLTIKKLRGMLRLLSLAMYEIDQGQVSVPSRAQDADRYYLNLAGTIAKIMTCERQLGAGDARRQIL